MSGTTIQPDAEALRAALVGHQFPGGTVRVEPYAAWPGHEAMGLAPRTGGLLNPQWMLVVGLRGMGSGISGVIEFGRLDPADRVLFGGLELEQVLDLPRSLPNHVADGDSSDRRPRD